ncbi:MAG: dipeptide epimerase [Elusimicrobia bacterium]|nr:dipeptide epimerase [Elusimicrobiota bacterium]
MTGTTVRRAAVRVFETPLKRPFVTALGRKTATCNVGFTLTLRDGTQGYGEASASLALAHLSPRRLASVLGRLGRWVAGKDAGAPRPLVEEAWQRHAEEGPAAAAFECALLDAWTRSQGLTLASWFGGVRRALSSDITLSAWTDERLTAEAAAEAAEEGFRIFKVKVGGAPGEDLARLRAAWKAAGRIQPRFILDGNQGLRVDSALRLLDSCRRSGLRVLLLEQPLPKADLRGMAALTRRSPVPVAADEMVHSPADALRVIEAGAASAINIKVAKSGLLRALDIAALARTAGLPLMIGCMSETSRGLMPSVHLALGTGFFSYVDLDSDHLLREHDRSPDWRRDGPRLSLP